MSFHPFNPPGLDPFDDSEPWILFQPARPPGPYLTARGGSLLVGNDGKLTTNDDCCCDEECANCDGWSLNFCFCRDPITGFTRFKDSIIFDITGTVPGGTSFGYSLGPQALPPVDVAGSYEFFFGPQIGPCTQINKTYFLHAPIALGDDIFGDYLYAVLLLVDTISSYPNSTTVSLVSAVIRNIGSTELPVPTEDAYAVAGAWQSEILNLSTIEVFPCGEDLTCLCRVISGLVSDLDLTGSYGHGLHTGITGNAEYTY